MPKLDVVNLMVWNQLKQYLPPGTLLTSVHRTAIAQLNFIVSHAKRLGYSFPRPPSVPDQGSWQGALEFLRQKGYKVAPPGRSTHQQGIAYDLQGPDLPRIEAGVRKAVAERRITLANSRSAILIERTNHCVHVEVMGAVLLNEQFVDVVHTA